MDSNDTVEAHDDLDRRDEATAVDPTSAQIIGANLNAMNAGTGTGGVVAPAAMIGAAEAGVDKDDNPVNLDVLGQFGSRRKETGDQAVSTKQEELESDELNG